MPTRPHSLASKSLAPWLHCGGSQSFYSTEHTGKWCVFRYSACIDLAWSAVCDAVIDNKLVFAKVSRARDNQHVICVYTLNWADEAEMSSSRETLSELGFNEVLAYKRDIETMNNVYGTPAEWYRHA